jgi:large subunit ribosomal protein L10
MAKTKAQKIQAVEQFEQKLKTGTSVVFVHFKGISVAEESKVRVALRGENVGYTVIKKSLARRALTNLGHGTDLKLEGEIAMAYDITGTGDPTAPARRIFGFTKELKPDRFLIVGGIFEGKLVDGVAMNEIATIPPIQVLRGMFVNVINSPIAGLARVLQAVADKRAEA